MGPHRSTDRLPSLLRSHPDARLAVPHDDSRFKHARLAYWLHELPCLVAGMSRLTADLHHTGPVWTDWPSSPGQPASLLRLPDNCAHAPT